MPCRLTLLQALAYNIGAGSSLLLIHHDSALARYAPDPVLEPAAG